jgi:hypothetical protein
MNRYGAPSHGSSLRESQCGVAIREGSAVSADFRSLNSLNTEPKHGSLNNDAGASKVRRLREQTGRLATHICRNIPKTF